MIDTGTPEGHGTYGGTTRDDGSEQENPEPSEDAEDWTEKVDAGGEAAP